MGTYAGENVGTSRRPSVKRGIGQFEDLTVWQTARELVAGVCRAAKTQELRHDSPLRNQMKRAAVSIGSNIAEGYERGTREQQIESCYYAKGSAGEFRSQVVTAHDVGLLEATAYEWLMEMCDECSRQLHSYIKHLQSTQHTIRGLKHALRPEAEPDA
ncbi:MAG: four helix bundle protein [Planctomycetes bacterium]|nr:four helix bundle protein [Planctomycetota bacterium]